MFVLNITKKKSRALLFAVVPFGAIPLSPLFLSLTIATHTETAPLPEGQCEATALLATTEHSCSQRSPEGLCHVVTEGRECGYASRDHC